MNDIQQQPVTESGTPNSPITGYILVAVLTALIVGGGFLYFGAWSTTETIPTTDLNYIETVTPAGTPVASDTVTSTPPLEIKDDPTKNESIREVLAASFKQAIEDDSSANFAQQNPTEPTKFYYITNASNPQGNAILEYDANRDYKLTGGTLYDIDLAEGSKVLLKWTPTAKNREIQGVGLSGNNYVFFEQDSDYSPGPCSGPEFWLTKIQGINLMAIDVTAAKPVAKPYTPTVADKASAEKEKAACMVEILE